jgi:hypothetical protein
MRHVIIAPKKKTVTRSVSFDQEMFDFMESDRQELRLDRSQYLRERLEERREAKQTVVSTKSGGAGNAKPTRNGLPLFPFRPRTGKATLKLVNELRESGR